MTWRDVEVRELKVGSYIIINDEPCRIVELTTSKPGKHGEAKARIVAMGVFDNQKRSLVYPVKHRVKSPIIEKKTAQVLVLRKNYVQLMDTSTFETFELEVPEEFKNVIEAGKNVEYWETLGKRKIMKA